MEKSNKKLANTLLYSVIGLCLTVILIVSFLTANSKNTPPKLEPDDVTTAVRTEQTTKREEMTSKIYEKATEAVTTSEKAESSDKQNKTNDSVKPTVNPVKETYSSPVNGYISKEYTIDVPVYSVTMNDYRAHTGVDFVCEEGSAVASCASGTVKSVYSHPMMGTTVVIEHKDGISSYYMNLSETLPSDITEGATVTKGQLIGAVGSTAIVEVAQEPHLHLEMTVAGAYVDPLTIIDMSTVTVMSDQAFE